MHSSMNRSAEACERLATAVTAPLPLRRIAFQFLRAIAAVLKNPQRQTDSAIVSLILKKGPVAKNRNHSVHTRMAYRIERPSIGGMLPSKSLRLSSPHKPTA